MRIGLQMEGLTDRRSDNHRQKEGQRHRQMDGQRDERTVPTEGHGPPPQVLEIEWN